MTVVNKILSANNSKVNICATTYSATSDIWCLSKHLLT